MKLYLGDQLIGHNENVQNEMTDLGKNVKAYLGKSFYSEDGYFKGAFDNIKVYNRVLRDVELAGGVLGDKTELLELLEKYKDMDASVYTEESYKAFKDAYDAATTVAENPDALEKEVADAVQALKQSVENLKQVESQEPENPDDTNNNGTPGGGQNTGNNNSGNHNSSNQIPENPIKPEAVKTGDTANMSIIFFLIGSAGIAAMLIRRRRF